MNILLFVYAIWSSIYIDHSDGKVVIDGISHASRFYEESPNIVDYPAGGQLPVCNCNGKWMKGSCNSDGECECKTGHEGDNCEQCTDGFYKEDGGECKSCECNDDGMTGNCDNPRECQCKPGYDKEHNCYYCSNGFYRQVDGSCKTCGCNDDGMTGECYANGDCKYVPGYKGLLKKKCNCFGEGATGRCRSNGECICQSGYGGRDCDMEVTPDGLPQWRLTFFDRVPHL